MYQVCVKAGKSKYLICTIDRLDRVSKNLNPNWFGATFRLIVRRFFAMILLLSHSVSQTFQICHPACSVSLSCFTLLGSLQSFIARTSEQSPQIVLANCFKTKTEQAFPPPRRLTCEKRLAAACSTREKAYTYLYYWYYLTQNGLISINVI